MFLERDAKVILILRSVYGIATFSTFYAVMLVLQTQHANSNFALLQIMFLGIISILTLILIGSLISLKKEITKQQQYLQNLPAQPIQDKEVKVPYNKSGLYSIIVAAVLGIFAFLYMYSVFVLEPQEYKNTNLGMLSVMILSILAVFILMLLGSVFLLMRRIRTPLYYTYKSCPRCGSDDIIKVEYSWLGGILSSLVHQVRCKKCGMTYDGVAGTDVTRKIRILFTVGLILLIILMIVSYLI